MPHVCAVCLLCGGQARQTVCGASLVWLASQASSGAAREKVMLAVSITYAMLSAETLKSSRGAVAAKALRQGTVFAYEEVALQGLELIQGLIVLRTETWASSAAKPKYVYRR